MNAETASALEQSVDVEIGRRIHMLMWDRQIKQTELAPRLGIEQSGLSKKLRGSRAWSASDLVTAARALDTTVAYLVGESDEVGQSVHPLGFEPRTHCFRKVH